MIIIHLDLNCKCARSWDIDSSALSRSKHLNAFGALFLGGQHNKDSDESHP